MNYGDQVIALARVAGVLELPSGDRLINEFWDVDNRDVVQVVADENNVEHEVRTSHCNWFIEDKTSILILIIRQREEVKKECLRLVREMHGIGPVPAIYKATAAEHAETLLKALGLWKE